MNCFEHSVVTSLSETLHFNCSYEQKLQEKNWKAMEALSAAEKTSSEKVSKAVADQKVVIPQWVIVINLSVA